jgi:Zn-dependent membrane protease YugP
VAAHEVGHAIQDRSGYKPLKTRTRMIGTAQKLERIGAIIMMAVPVLAGVTRAPSVGVLMFIGGLATLGIPVLVHLLTLPTEFDASFKRALPLLVSGSYIPPQDLPAARKILTACALTYVASSLVGLLNVWRWIRVLRR